MAQTFPKPDMVFIPPGSFIMGSPPDEADRGDNEGPLTWVTISRGFWMGKYEVTQGEYQAVMGNNPSAFPGDPRRPVEMEDWYDATNYCAKLTEQERTAGRIPADGSYRLPTEAEWEYACRAGTSTRFSFGDDPAYVDLGNYAWHDGNSGGMSHPVGEKLPNPWGLYDMHGNVFEWCQDFYHWRLPGGSVVDPKGPLTGSVPVFKGGAWTWSASWCRSAYRDYPWAASDERSFFGFRVVFDPGLSWTPPPPPLRFITNGIWRPTGTNSAHLVQLAGTAALTVADDSNIYCLDLSDFSKPMLAGTWGSSVSPAALCIRGNLAFIAGWETNVISTVEVVDFSDSDHPVWRGLVETPGRAQDIALAGQHAFVADGESGLLIVDVSDPSTPRRVGNYPTRGSLTHIAVSGDVAYLGMQSGLLFVDVTDPSQPFRLGGWATAGSVRGLAVQGGKLFALEADKGLHILDVQYATRPRMLGRYSRVPGATAIAVEGNYALLAGGGYGVQLLDISDPSRPEWVGTFATTAPNEDVVMSGNRVWVAAGTQGVVGFEFVDQRLKVERASGAGSTIMLTWQGGVGWELQRTDSLEGNGWETIPGSATTNRITAPALSGIGFYRLHSLGVRR
jgi:formylglycine-generating enzyme required for sulfatase activity